MTTPSYRINTPFRNYFFYKDEPNIAQPLTDGYLVFRSDTDHNVFLAVYSDVSDPDNPVQYPTVEIIINDEVVQAVQLAGDGGIGVIYLQDLPYFIQCYSVELSLQFNVEHYEGATYVPPEPPPSGGGNFTNLILDGQFIYGIPVNAPANGAAITNTGWFISINNPSVSGNVTFPDFAAGDTSVPFSPINSFHYTNTVTSDYIYQTVYDARSLSNQQLTISFWAKSGTSTRITFGYIYNFGPSGSSPISNGELSADLTETWTQYSATFTLPSLAGKVVNYPSYLQFTIQFNTAPVDVFLANVFLSSSSTLENYPYLTPAEVWAQASKFALSYQLPAQEQWIANGDQDGASQTSYKTSGGGYISVATALDELFASSPVVPAEDNFDGSITPFQPGGLGTPIYFVNSVGVVTGGADSTTDTITNTAGTGKLYLTLDLPTPVAGGGTYFVDISLSIPSIFNSGGTTSVVAIDVNGSRITVLPVPASQGCNGSMKCVAPAAVGSNTVEVYYGGIGATTTTVATLAPFTVTSTLTAQYIIKAT